jgi:Cu-Zn family superoxide dismutase
MKRFSVLLGSVLLMTACNHAAVPVQNGALLQGFQNIIRDRAGVEVGLVGSPGVDAKGLRLTIWVHDLPPGVHGMHLHEGGLCDPPAFAGAGAHWNPAGRKHGHQNPEGPHAGDLGNLTVKADGKGSAEALIAKGTMGPTPSGLAIVIHAKPDDEKTDPSGNSGDRIACGIIFPAR